MEVLMLGSKNTKWILLIPLLATAGFHAYSASAEWQRPLQPSFSGGDLVCLTAHPQKHSGFLIANNSQLFEGSSSSGWKMLWSGAGKKEGIVKVFTDPSFPDHAFLLTSGTIFKGNLLLNSWETVYRSGNSADKKPLSFAVDPENPSRWFAGTSGGLWVTLNAGKDWARSGLVSDSEAVKLLNFTENGLLIGSNTILRLSLLDSEPQIVFELPPRSLEFPGGTETDDEEEFLYASRLFELIKIPGRANHFFLGTDEGVFESSDGGHSWEPLPQSGLQSTKVLGLAYSGKTASLFAATPRGTYRYHPDKESWQVLSDGLAKAYTKSLAVVNDSVLIGITGDGFVEYPVAPEPPASLPMQIFMPEAETLELLKKLISLEPSSRDIHNAVIRYADVSNGKIKRWHAESRLAMLVPKFTFNKSSSGHNTIDLDRGSTNDPDKYILGPESFSNSAYRTISWDLGDAIYSSAQTSIDSRGKLMVELRQDLLSEATRIYYERRRLQIDIVYEPSPSEQKHLDRLIRLDELTALLDAMTDGFLSKRLEEIYERNVELNGLWIYCFKAERGLPPGT